MSAQEVASGEATKLDLAAVRAEVVGSLLRPPGLVAARRQRASGVMDAAAFKRGVDRTARGRKAPGQGNDDKRATGGSVLRPGEVEGRIQDPRRVPGRYRRRF